ncbi:putative transcription regulator protein [Oleiphilus messinensis]|uniref:Putative transcription regulator protein n=1 Tax=Oleiphilus messinensis TaxID=141451 RepID=A0A1Y0I1I4_9GAMM|nr:LysR family transcriptional regulator [Oleiphilus messinensis]ARU54328.1 putative transcription regulator protein [Oleiphilus messinensis]
MNKLNLMEAYIAVFEAGSYTAAGKRLGKTKALVSTQVSQLEDYLQIRLITRSTRTIKPTSAGVAYYEQAKQILDEIANLESRLRSEHHELVGRLRISVPTTYGELVVMPFMARLLERYPRLEIDIVLNDRYVDIIEEGFDAAIRIGDLEDSALVASFIGNVDMQLYAAPGFLRAHGQPETWAQLSGFPCIFDCNTRHVSNWAVQVDSGKLKVDLNQVIRVNSALAAANLAKSGAGISFGPDFALRESVAKGELVLLLEDQHQTRYPVHILYPHRKYLSARVSTFITEFKQYIAESGVISGN